MLFEYELFNFEGKCHQMVTTEMLDIYDEQDQHLGTCERSEVHRLGHWHHTFHCWLIRDTVDGRLLVFQKRHPDKDTFPDMYDITAAGHLSAGETFIDAAREIQEELGLPLRYEQLTHVLDIRDETFGSTRHGAFIDREVSSVFGAFSPYELPKYQLQQDEVSGIFEAPLQAMIELYQGKCNEVMASGVYTTDTTATIHKLTVHREQFVPHEGHYYIDVFQKLLTL